MSTGSPGLVAALTKQGGSLATACAVLCMLLLAAPVSGQSLSLAPSCYDLELGTWQPFIELQADSIYVAPPPRIFLDTIPGEGLGRPVGFALTTAPGAIPSIHRMSWWQPAGSDSIELVWTTGFSGLQAKLATTEHPFVGTARTMWDFARPVQHASITVTAVSCDAPIREENAFRYRFPRGIGMAESDSILVGEVLPQSDLRSDEHGVNSVLIQGVPAAPFQDALELRVSLTDDDKVSQIRFNLPESVTHEAAVAAMSTQYGAPTSHDRSASNSGDVRYLTSWSDRLISIAVWGGGKGQQTVLIRDRRER